MRKLGILFLLTAALAGGLVATDGVPTALAQQACGFTTTGVEICLSLDPETATNPVGTDHTVTGTASWDGGPMPGFDTFLTEYMFSVESGPNAGKFLLGQVDANSQLSFTYTGDGGPGIDTIEFCFFLASGGTGGCTGFVDPVVATKEWTAAPPTDLPSTQAPTPTMTVPPPIAAATSTVPPPIATATSAPTSNGGNPADGSSGFPWWALAIAAAIGLLGSLAVGSAYWRGRAR